MALGKEALFGIVFSSLAFLLIITFIIIHFLRRGLTVMSSNQERELAESLAAKEIHREAVLALKTVKGELPVETIEGIGRTHGGQLNKIGIIFVYQLAEAKPEDVARAAKVSKETAEFWIAMASLTMLDTVSEEDAEGIVKAANITTIVQLSEADAEELYTKITQAIENKQVQVPARYKLTKKRVRAWLREANKLVRK